LRWSPDGSLLASGDDESVIIVWQLKPVSFSSFPHNLLFLPSSIFLSFFHVII
jgi:hypothetical protein